MTWFDKLKTLIKIEVKAPIVSINLTNNSNNRYDPTEKRLEVGIGSLDETQKKQLLGPIIKEYIDEGNKLLEKETSQLLYRLYKYNKENNNGPILSFFNPIIPPLDYQALDAALFLRDRFRERENVTKLKKDIRDRFGDRGNNISNLCTAGYFEEFLMPLYNSSKERFNELYEIIVSKLVLAVFVHKDMAHTEIPTQIREKLEISKKYGIKFIHIHAIGMRNISKVEECIEENRKFFDFFEKKIYENKEYGIVIVELLVK